MKRIKEACICQTIHFSLKEEVQLDLARKLVGEEVARYKAGLEKSGTKFRILEENEQPDGSLIIKLKKQYNSSPVGSYLD